MQSELRFYSRVVILRRLPLLLIIFLLLTGAGLYMALTLPPLYHSSAKLLVEAPQIPDKLASSTVETSATEQLQVIQQRISTRSNLIDLARKHKVYTELDQMSPDQIVSRMRADLGMKTSTGRDEATVMTVGFTARNGQIAADVTNDVVTQILNENVKLRTATAGDTLAFFQQEVKRLGNDLDQQSAKIIDFQNKNLNALPSGQSYRMSQQSSLQERLTQMRRELTQLETQRQNLLSMFAATGSVNGQSQGNSTEAQLAKAQSDLAQAKLVYSTTNPKVKMLQNRVDQLQQQADAAQAKSLERARADAAAARPETGADQGTDQSAGQSAGQATDVPATAESTGNPALDVQLADIDSRRTYLQQQIPQIQQQIDEISKNIDATPANSIVLDGLQRDYDNIQSQYNAAREGLAQAATGERIELGSKGQRITVIEQAVTPDSPSSPNRKKIAAMGGGAGIAASFGLVALLEMLSSTIRRPSDLTRKLSITPLATIPYIPAPGETTRNLTRHVMIILGVAVVIAIALFLLNALYMPLSMLMDIIRSRLNL